jgi:GTP pyrophosphokinase
MPEFVYSIDELIELITKTYENPDIDMVRRAYAMAEEAHRGEKRLTGHDFVSHPVSVAYKLAEWGIHLNVITAGILHDVVEDTDIPIEDVADQFGDDVASLVAAVTKLKTVRLRGEARYVENLRKMFLAMASDVRVVFIKFADRLHNLQTLYAMPKYKQKRTALETLEIFAPIAGRLGMNEVRGELEDSSFAYLDPKEYENMQHILDTKVREKGAYISRLIDQTERVLESAEITNVQVHGRVKRLYSLYKKLQRYNNDIEKIYDLIAVRVIVQDVEDCYAVLGVLHRTWKPIPGRIKDFLAQPKPNGYQSLHTTIFADGGENVEFQIRTREMHELAEFGVAAHWRYKDVGDNTVKNVRWMEELGRIHKELSDKKEFLHQLDMMKIDLFKDRIFVFTPNGDVIDLPEGATPVDFAYHIHTQIGNTCTSARVNDLMRNLDTTLKSGDIVEIITDKNRSGPNPDWLKFVKTRHARIKIKDATKNTMKGWVTQIMHGRERAGKKSKKK